jgi:hypothetical protein
VSHEAVPSMSVCAGPRLRLWAQLPVWPSI